MDLKLDLSNVSEEKLAKILELLKEDGGDKQIQIQPQTNSIFSKKNRKITTEDIETYRQLNIIHKMGVDNFWKEVKRIVESKVEIEKDETDDKIDQRYLM